MHSRPPVFVRPRHPEPPLFFSFWLTLKKIVWPSGEIMGHVTSFSAAVYRSRTAPVLVSNACNVFLSLTQTALTWVPPVSASTSSFTSARTAMANSTAARATNLMMIGCMLTPSRSALWTSLATR
jgi:hypothetical protein